MPHWPRATRWPRSSYAVVAFTAAMTLEELGIAPELVRSAFVILFGAGALALALAFGLGCKDLARE
jgi:hypothetical protein